MQARGDCLPWDGEGNHGTVREKLYRELESLCYPRVGRDLFSGYGLMETSPEERICGMVGRYRRHSISLCSILTTKIGELRESFAKRYNGVPTIPEDSWNPLFISNKALVPADVDAIAQAKVCSKNNQRLARRVGPW